jgi:transposase
MNIVGGFDVHRSQITFDYLDTESGQINRGPIGPADRLALRSWLARFDGAKDVHFAVEGCTGWRFVAEECAAAGVIAHLADPGEAAAARGKKRRAKTDKLDARHLRHLLVQARLPEAWVPPTEVQEWRAKVRLYKDLGDERTDWMQRVRATRFHQGLPARRSVFSPEGRAELLGGEGLSPAGAQQVAVALRQIDRLDAELAALHNEICIFGRRHAGCRALWSGLYGVGYLTSVMIWAEMGDTRRFSASRQAVRHTGLDITVYSSDDHRARGHLARQGPALLRWALFEAAKSAAKQTSPEHGYYKDVAAREGANRATLSVARPGIGGHVGPCPPHHIAAGELVVKGVEPPCWVLLGAAVKHALESTNGAQAFGLSDGPSRSLGTHQRSSALSHASMKQGPFARTGLCCPGLQPLIRPPPTPSRPPATSRGHRL